MTSGKHLILLLRKVARHHHRRRRCCRLHGVSQKVHSDRRTDGTTELGKRRSTACGSRHVTPWRPLYITREYIHAPVAK